MSPDLRITPLSPQPDDALETLAASLRGGISDQSGGAAAGAESGIVVHCTDVADVVAAVRYANASGQSVFVLEPGLDGASRRGRAGIMIDLSPMDGVRIDPIARTVRAEGGCLWSAIDHVAHAFGLTAASGALSSPGVGGLTQWGGTGVLSRTLGLAIDSVLATDVVLADGSLVTASEDEHPDLFWALQEGGRCVGVVTSWLLRAYPIESVIAGHTEWAMEQAEEVLRWFREFMTDAPPELNGMLTLQSPPDGPANSQIETAPPRCIATWCWTGIEAEVATLLASNTLPSIPARHELQQMWLPEVQRLVPAKIAGSDPQPRMVTYLWHLRDTAIEQLVGRVRGAQSSTNMVQIHALAGGSAWLEGDGTASRRRNARWAVEQAGHDEDARSMSVDTRLDSVKTVYDPENRFRISGEFPVQAGNGASGE